MPRITERNEEDQPSSKRPRRSRRTPAEAEAAASSSKQKEDKPIPTTKRPEGRVLIVHANGKPYGHGPQIADWGSKKMPKDFRFSRAAAANRDQFDFSCADYTAMRDSGSPYSGDPRKNKLLPLPRPTYTEFINRAKAARMLDRLDFFYCSSEARTPPRLTWGLWERVVWCGVTFRRFARRWTPERAHFFTSAFQRRALTVLCAAKRLPKTLGALPHDILLDLVASVADGDCRMTGDYDDIQTVASEAKHLFLPAPGSSADRDTLFDGVFGLT